LKFSWKKVIIGFAQEAEAQCRPLKSIACRGALRDSGNKQYMEMQNENDSAEWEPQKKLEHSADAEGSPEGRRVRRR
jgi:hypothetical protein